MLPITSDEMYFSTSSRSQFRPTEGWMEALGIEILLLRDDMRLTIFFVIDNCSSVVPFKLISSDRQWNTSSFFKMTFNSL